MPMLLTHHLVVWYGGGGSVFIAALFYDLHSPRGHLALASGHLSSLRATSSPGRAYEAPSTAVAFVTRRFSLRDLYRYCPLP